MQAPLQRLLRLPFHAPAGRPALPLIPRPSSPLLLDSMVSDRIGRVFSTLPLASYTLGEQIGEGTFSTVFLARRKAGCREVALKLLIPTGLCFLPRLLSCSRDTGS